MGRFEVTQTAIFDEGYATSREFNLEIGTVVGGAKQDSLMLKGHSLFVQFENAVGGYPVGLVYAEGQNMLRDRAVAISQTQMFAPRQMLHFVTNVRILGVTDEEIIAQELERSHRQLERRKSVKIRPS